MLMLTPAQLELSVKFKAFLERWRYDIWLTVTFGVRIDEYDAVKEVKYFLKHVSKPFKPFGVCYNGDYIYCWLFVEQKPWHDRVHIHSLIQRIDPIHAKDLEWECRQCFGEAVAKPYNPALRYRATEYIAEKYALGWLKSFNFYRINSKYRRQPFKLW